MTTILSALAEVRSVRGLNGLAGPALTRNGDIIARLTGLSRSWIGLVLVATGNVPARTADRRRHGAASAAK
jgi:cation:H+ antiporter